MWYNVHVGGSVHARRNGRRVPALAIVLLMLVSAVIGGALSYMFTIAPFIKTPEGTTLAITGVHIDKRDATSFKISILNPSYSPGSATVTRIALSLKGKGQLYDVVKTDPPIKKGIKIPRGGSLNVTCSMILEDGVNATWGMFAGKWAGETIVVHVFSPDSQAANVEVTLPLIKLRIVKTEFDSKVSFNRFSVTVMSDPKSEINLTIASLVVPGVDVKDIRPILPRPIAAGESISFVCSGNWHGLKMTSITIYTEEGYVFYKDVKLPIVHVAVKSVDFNEDYTDHFNVTVFNFAESAHHVNVVGIRCTLDNGTVIDRGIDPPVSVEPGSTATFKFDWSWRGYRGRAIKVVAYTLQELETIAYEAVTPQPVIVKVLNGERTFHLRDRGGFNITIQNHASSLEAVNVTKIVVKETGEVVNGTMAEPPLPYGPIEPGRSAVLRCSIADWSGMAGGKLTLIVHCLTDETLKEYVFEFVFDLPVAEINVVNVSCAQVHGMRCLEVIVENLNYSVRDVMILKVMVNVEDQPEPLEYILPKRQVIVKPGDRVVLLFPFNWEEHLGKNVTVNVVTGEGVKASLTFNIPSA